MNEPSHSQHSAIEIDEVSDDLSSASVLSAKAAARYLGIGYSTLSQWRNRGEGPAFVKYGRSRTCRVVYERSSLDSFIARWASTGPVASPGEPLPTPDLVFIDLTSPDDDRADLTAKVDACQVSIDTSSLLATTYDLSNSVVIVITPGWGVGDAAALLADHDLIVQQTLIVSDEAVDQFAIIGAADDTDLGPYGEHRAVSRNELNAMAEPFAHRAMISVESVDGWDWIARPPVRERG